MNEITLQIIEIGKLIGKKVFVTLYCEGKFYNENEVAVSFTVDDFDFYSYKILGGKIELMDIKYINNFGKYHLVTFKQL